MPVRDIKGIDVALTIKQTTPLGKIVMYFYEEGTPVHSTLRTVYELISRKCPNSQFYSASSDNCDEETLNRLNIYSFPTFLVTKDGEVISKFEVATKEGLIKQMQRAGVLDSEITDLS